MASHLPPRNALNQSIGVAFLRIIAGLIFLLQGYAKVFTWGLDNVYAMAFADMEKVFPEWLLHATNYFTAYAELVGGLMLVVGLFRDYAIWLLCAVLLVVTFGHGAAEGIWKLDDVLFRGILLAALLLLPRAWDRYVIHLKLGRFW